MVDDNSVRDDASFARIIALSEIAIKLLMCVWLLESCLPLREGGPAREDLCSVI
jgi:hypothetical protein